MEAGAGPARPAAHADTRAAHQRASVQQQTELAYKWLVPDWRSTAPGGREGGTPDTAAKGTINARSRAADPDRKPLTTATRFRQAAAYTYPATQSTGSDQFGTMPSLPQRTTRRRARTHTPDARGCDCYLIGTSYFGRSGF